MTRSELSFPILLGFAVAIGILIGSYFDFENQLALFKSNKEQKIKKLIGYIQYNYIEEVATDSLLDDAIKSIVSKLDPHSAYISKEDQIHVSENMNGSFVGIGIRFMMLNDTVVVSKVLQNSPSIIAGLKPGDRLIAADDKSLLKKDFEKENHKDDSEIKNTIVKSLRGEAGSEIDLEVYRKTLKRKLNFKVKRAPVAIKSVAGHYMINKKLGYIHLDRFSKNTALEFNLALCDLIKQGMSALVIDLRGNPGGYIEVAQQIADEFLSEGRFIFSTKNHKGEEEKSIATKNGDFEKGDLYVLIDRHSASASEVLAGALQDNDRATIIGRRSFGKALVQEEMDLGDGSVVRLTTSEYHTASGRSIQKPYERNKPHDDYFNETNQRISSGELLSKELIPINKEKTYKTLSGRAVYGSCGIIPDIFVPLDKSEIDQITSGFHRKVNDFTIRYLDKKRAFFEKMTLDEFIRNSNIEKEIADAFIKKSGLDFINLQEHKKQELEVEIKSILARNLFDETTYYKIAHKKDKMILRVIADNKN